MLVTALLKASAETLLNGGFNCRVTCVGTGAEASVSNCEDLVRFLSAQAVIADAAKRQAGAHPLTGQQRRVLALLAAGRTNEEIGRELGIAVGTVRKHVEGTYRRLGVRNRAEAVAFALGAGIDLAHRAT